MLFHLTFFSPVLLTMTNDVIGYQGRFCDGNKILDTMQHVIKCNGRGKNCKAVNHSFIGFDATLGKLLRNIRRGQKIVFDHISVNEGNAYKDGVFTCPVPGIYYFSWTILAFQGKNSDTYITVNGTTKRINFSREYSGKHYYSGTTSVLLHLNKGDNVWIQMNKENDGNAHSGHSFFTGMLMRSD